MVSCDSFALLCGALGKITIWCNKLPSEFRQTTLQPVLNPGSIPKVLFCPSGAARSNWRRFSAKTLMASASACSFARAKTSFFIAGKRSRLYPSSMASWMSWAAFPFDLIKKRAILWMKASSSNSILIDKKPSFSPLLIAKRRWEEHLFKRSE